jgi:DNA-binding beta-propeller fold protein YncE
VPPFGGHEEEQGEFMKRPSLLRNRKLLAGVVGIVVFLALGFGQAALERSAAAQGEGLTWGPMFEVDPLWPKPLPNHWVIGATIGVAVDERDHVWIVHRASTLNAGEIEASADPQVAVDCCVAAPPVLEFDQAGNLVGYWGGPGEGYEWPKSNHGIAVDHKSNVWIGGNDRDDAHVLKFTRHGQFLLQVGRAGQSQGSNDMQNFSRVAKIFVDPRANEAYISDGYGNRRVVVIDADTGEFKRYWGAYGNVPDDTDLGRYDPRAPAAKQFRTPVHCAELSTDQLLYVCDRVNDRIQVFNPDGTFVKELFIEKETLGAGSVWDIAFSKDADQTYLYVADGVNEKVYIVERKTLELVSSFGDGGRQPGQFYGTHSIATDSHGNVYTTETFEGKRLQKFAYKGMGTIRTPHQGVLWPGAN